MVESPEDRLVGKEFLLQTAVVAVERQRRRPEPEEQCPNQHLHANAVTERFKGVLTGTVPLNQ